MNILSKHPLLEKLVYSFARAFLATFLVGVTGLLAAPNWTAGKAVFVALVVAGVTAGARAAQHVLIDGPKGAKP